MGKAGPRKQYVPNAVAGNWVPPAPDIDWRFWEMAVGVKIGSRCREDVEFQLRLFGLGDESEEFIPYSEMKIRTLAVINNPDVEDEEVIRQAALHTAGDIEEYYDVLMNSRDDVVIQWELMEKTHSREIRDIFAKNRLPVKLSNRYINEDDDRYPEATPIEEFLNKYILKDDISAASTRKTIYNYLK